MSADDDDVLVCRVGTFDLADEARGADYVQGRYAEESLGVVDVFGLEDFGYNGDGGVDLVRGEGRSAFVLSSSWGQVEGREM